MAEAPSVPSMAASLLDALTQLAREAGAAVMQVYAGDFDVRGKDDDSPVTDADVRAEAIITPALRQLLPGVPVVAEEAVAAGDVPAAARRFWLVDPLDGTREFAQRNGQFTVNIALIDRGVPVAGVVFAPALDRLFAGAAGHGAFAEQQGHRQAIQARKPPAEGLTIWSSRSHGSAGELQRWLDARGGLVAAHKHVGSSLKFCLLACGEGDLYPRLSRTMEWDTAAGHAVLVAAGGDVVQLDGMPLRYGKPGYENPSFLARGAET